MAIVDLGDRNFRRMYVTKSWSYRPVDVTKAYSYQMEFIGDQSTMWRSYFEYYPVYRVLGVEYFAFEEPIRVRPEQLRHRPIIPLTTLLPAGGELTIFMTRYPWFREGADPKDLMVNLKYDDAEDVLSWYN